MVTDATAAFAGPFWNQLGLPTPCKSSKSRLPDAEITRGRRSPRLLFMYFVTVARRILKLRNCERVGRVATLEDASTYTTRDDLVSWRREPEATEAAFEGESGTDRGSHEVPDMALSLEST